MPSPLSTRRHAQMPEKEIRENEEDKEKTRVSED